MKIKYKLSSIIEYKLIRKVIKLISFLKPSTKKNLKLIIFVMLLNSYAEFITISSLIPLIDIAYNPNNLSRLSFLNLVFDYLNIQENYQFIAISILFIIIITLSTFFKIFALRLINGYIATLTKELGQKLYRGVLYQDYSFHIKTNSSKLLNSLTHELDVSVSVVANILNTILTLLSIFGIFISLSIINFKLVVYIGLIFTVFYSFITITTNKFADIYGKLLLEKRIKETKIIQESLGFIRQILLDNSQEVIVKEYHKNKSKVAQVISELTIIQQIPRYLLESIILLVIAITLIIMVSNQIDLGNYISLFGAFLLGIQKLIPLFQKTFVQVFQINSDKYSLNSVISYLNYIKNLEVNDRSIFKRIFHLNEKIIFDNVSFSYKENIILQNINCQIRKGEHVGIVGKTGAGKTTFIDLLMGFIKPKEGNIFIDDKKMNPKLFEEFRLSISNVPQDYYLLDRSIEENIVFGNNQNKIDYKLLNNVINSAMLRGYVNTLKLGLKTFVGEDGIKLSGGQKQRVSIARALYKKHTFLLLDEATSSIDSGMEKKIINNIIKNYPDITIIMIAHRLETLKKCDYILEIKDKKLIKHNNIKDYKSSLI